MIATTRRSFLAAAAAAPALRAAWNEPLSVQLYTVRNVLPKDPRGTLAEIARIGFTYVEPVQAQLTAHRALIDELKFRVVSCHFDKALMTGTAPDGMNWSKACEQARSVGLKYMVVPYIPLAERKGLDFYRQFADQMNQAGEETKQAGMQLCYHHHSFEFGPLEGKRPFDILEERFDKRLVHWEADVFWLKVGGEDPAARLRAWKGRVPLVHMKDLKPGTATEFSEARVPRDAFKEVGNGMLDIPGILKACRDAGVKSYVIEQDQTSGNPLDSLGQSYRYLRGLKT